MRISDWSSDVCSSDLHKYKIASFRHGSLFLCNHTYQWMNNSFKLLSGLRTFKDQFAHGLAVERARGRNDIGAELMAYRSEEHTSELQSLMRSSYAVFCLKKKRKRS